MVAATYPKTTMPGSAGAAGARIKIIHKPTTVHKQFARFMGLANRNPIDRVVIAPRLSIQ